MRIFGYEINKAELKSDKSNAPTEPGGDVTERGTIAGGIFKAHIPEFLYKPPFGYPRPENIPLLKYFAANPYVFSVINALQEEAACNDWDIVISDDDVEMTEELKNKKRAIKDFLINPNGNKESFSHLIKTCVRDICEIDSGVWVKVFNKKRELTQVFARDGGTILKNPDIYGYIGNRDDIVFPSNSFELGDFSDPQVRNQYDNAFGKRAAYYQYGWTMASVPIPFGKREIIYFMKNPRSDSIYGISPVKILADLILTLVYGSQYNLDFYMNSNMPEGIISLVGAQRSMAENVHERLKNTITIRDKITGFARKVGFKLPVVNVDAKFIPFQIPSREMQIIEQQEWFTKLVWMCFGISADDMGFTESSNKAVSEEMGRRFARKAVRPILQLIAERINMEIIPEFGTTELKFEWNNYDLDEDIKRHQLYESQIRMGIKTAEMIAEEEGIDVLKLKEQKEEEAQQNMERFANSLDKEENEKNQIENDDKNNPEIKSSVNNPFAGTDLEKELLQSINQKVGDVMDVFNKNKEKVKQNVRQSRT